jgi:hypothetical protein
MRFSLLLGLTLAVALLPAPSALAADAFHLLEPVRDAAGHAVVQVAADGRKLPVAQTYHGPLEARLRAVLGSGVAALLPGIDRQARAASRHAVDCPALDGGITIYLSDEDGGFARKDLFIETQPGKRELCADYFIDISVDGASLADGTFEEVLAHEYGHVLLRRLLGPVPPTPSRRMHSVLTLTDPVTAFDEGFGIQWQPLAARLTDTPGFRARVQGRALPSAANFWLSRRETWLRETAVPHDEFVYEPHLPNVHGDAYARWRAAETAWSADPCQLRSGNAMMASEGVAAAFMYHLLDQGANSREIAKRYVQLVRVLARMGRWPKAAPLVSLVREWGVVYPDERTDVTRLFLAVTDGATASVVAREEAARLSCTGARGGLTAFVPELKAYRARMARLAARVLGGQAALDGALGPSLWLANPAVRIATQPWSDTRDQPLVADLNTADQPTLTMLLGDRALAARLVAARRGGAYLDLQDASRRAALDRGEAERLRRMAASYRHLPAYVRG